jgi:phytoene dehydrogenase-like protein
VVGAGSNGLSAAIVAAQAGYSVEVFEAESEIGGAARTMEATLPGFHHDFGSAVHPMAASSPFFNSLLLKDHGLEWVHFPTPLAHPFDEMPAITLERDLSECTRLMDRDGMAWRDIIGPYVAHWDKFAADILQPIVHIPRNPYLLARFGIYAMMPATKFANRYFQDPRTKGLFAGLAAHSFLSLDEPMSSAIALVLGACAHTVGWPIPRGGAGAITRALAAELELMGGKIHTSQRVEHLTQLGNFQFALCDITPRQLQRLANLPQTYNRLLQRYKYGPGVFKVDYALSAPIPWKSRECARASTVHLGGQMEEIAESERLVSEGKHPEAQFVLLAQPTIGDPSRAPAGKHIAWAYCHVPSGSKFDMLARLEAQIMRFAPRFQEVVLERKVWTCADLEARDANLVGGDIVGGLANWRQLFFRPTWRQYTTPLKNVFLCSASTPPGGGVHGMCGANAARIAVKRFS